MAQPRTTRRGLFRLGGGALALTAMPGSSFARQGAAEIVRGVVFEDREETGERQPGDPGIPGVLVSNGRRVTRTDAQGRYELPVEPGSVIFVIKPAGWITPVDPVTKLPRFYRVHEPDGTPGSLDLAWPGVEPTGPLPESLDFPLRRNRESARFDVLMFADPQPANASELDYLRESFVSSLDGANAAFGVTLGDVMSDNLGLYEPYNRLMGQLGLPWFNLPGNHDLNYESIDNSRARETWKRVFGPPWYAFEHGEATFVMLDNVCWERGRGYRGLIGAAQLEFVENLLAHTPANRLIVVCMHVPLVSSETGAPASNTEDRDRLLGLLAGRPAVSFSGHMHTAEHHYLAAPGVRDAHHHQVLAAVSGSWWSGPLDAGGQPLAQCCDGSPNGYYVLSIDGTRSSTRFVSRESPAMRIMLDRREASARARNSATALTLDETMGAEVLVNIFDGGPRTRARLEVAGFRFDMKRVARPDPFTRDLYARNPDSVKSWVRAADSTHLWAASLPPSLGAGFHKLTVEARDEFGREFTQSLVFEIS